jgi:hypothetical protein
VFERVRTALKGRGLVTNSDLLSRLASHLAPLRQLPFDFVVVDEAQDISVAQLRFLAALGAGRPNRLFFAGDLGQRIFQQPFSWKALGVDIRVLDDNVETTICGGLTTRESPSCRTLLR